MSTYLSVLKYNSTESLLFSEYTTENLIASDYYSEARSISVMPNTTAYELYLEYRFSSSTLVEYHRAPESLLSAIAKIGGMLAFFKVSVFLWIAHQHMFEKKYLKKEKQMGGYKE